MIILGATPIGNLGDASPRLREALAAAEVIVAEDTRTAIHLLRALGVESRPRLIAMHDHNERERAAEIVELARETDVLVLSDAGMPTVSDPGFHLVDAAAAADVQVTAIPGPSAVVTALAVSGLATDRFTFEGFLPRKPGDRRSSLRALATEPRTMVFFESPNRLASSLEDIASVLGADRRVAVCRELTKLFEEVKRGTAAELAEWASGGVKGEICIVIAGAKAVEADPATALEQVLALVASGTRLKDASNEVAEATGLSKRDLYQAALAARPPKASPNAQVRPAP
ncbi:16S rRNA (cytidine(1402)-2'-O)-methyltransferase [Plantibacter cousiniae (nom. nud.)]|uniref:Ribosomal RNA small subunit methyltransferase I n=1 Tax=Plantibacter cousiniae (nom. nud.) TaxID=199709 RepID=A0ABY1LK36_9MICO|nr:16S rRNA (cytidine(1402)-2'-O)-methyltransferase [Plantibacter cousiniae]SKC51928.1 16S rRNA (cytidine1402-2'-O)-methyltransferase [Plantibacter cousiniae]